jgi:hypothetical protein
MKRREQQCKLYIRLDSGYEQDQERACPAWIFTSIETHTPQETAQDADPIRVSRRQITVSLTIYCTSDYLPSAE